MYKDLQTATAEENCAVNLEIERSKETADQAFVLASYHFSGHRLYIKWTHEQI